MDIPAEKKESVMQFAVGDTVLVKHSGEEGVVVAILDDNRVSVRVNGTSFPVFTDELEYPYFKRFMDRSREKAPSSRVRGEDLPIEKPAARNREETGVYLSFLPEYEDSGEEALVHTLKLHLLNETSRAYRFTYKLMLGGRLEIEVTNELAPFRHFYLSDLAFESLNDRPRFDFVFSLALADPAKRSSFSVTVKPKAKQVIRQLENLRRSGEATFSQLLFEAYPDKAAGQEESWDLPSPRPPFVSVTGGGLPPPVYEVDLHIEKLVEHSRGLSPGDMLAIQLSELRKQLDRAVAHRQASLIVIHGVGKGVLRQQIHEILQHVGEIKSFVNQYHARYGYGATEIFFEYK